MKEIRSGLAGKYRVVRLERPSLYPMARGADAVLALAGGGVLGASGRDGAGQQQEKEDFAKAGRSPH